MAERAAMSQPDLEIVDLGGGESFKAWAHGYPFRTVRWHFHPEYEIHLVTATQGRVFVGDHIGSFGPGNLVMTGPNLPHNWLSEVSPGSVVPERCLVLQFTDALTAGCVATFRELAFLPDLLAASSRGIEFTPAAGAQAEPILRALLTQTGTARLSSLLTLFGILGDDRDRRPLASIGYRADPPTYMTKPINHVLDHIGRNLQGELREADMAQLSGFSPSAFSRAFHRQTGTTFVHYVNGLRIKRACELLIGTDVRITDICHDVGFNNLSNFNRQFLAHKAMPPRAFRTHHRAQAQSGQHPPEQARARATRRNGL